MPVCQESDEVIQTFIKAYREGDVDTLADLYHVDAVLYNIDGISRGRDEIRAAWQGFADRFEVLDYNVLQREEESLGDYAFGHMTMSALLRERGAADPFTVHARSTEITRRGADGGWRFVVDHASVEIPK